MKDLSYLKRLSMSASVSSSIPPPPPSSSLRALSSTDLRILPSPSPARRARRRTRPTEERLSKITTRMSRLSTTDMCMLSRSPSWKRTENSFSPIREASPPRRGDVPGGQRGERGGVEVRRLPHGGQERPVLVDQEDHLRIGIGQKLLQDRLECVVFLLVEDEMTPVHSREDTTAIREGKEFEGGDIPDSSRGCGRGVSPQHVAPGPCSRGSPPPPPASRSPRESALALPPGKFRSGPPVLRLLRRLPGTLRRCGGVDEAACGARKNLRRAEPAASGRKG